MVTGLTRQYWMVKMWIWGIALFFGHPWCYYVPGYLNPIGWHWKYCKTWGIVYFICCSVSCQCYVTWLVFGVSFFCLERCLHYVGRWFHQLVYDFQLNVVSFLLLSLPKVILASGEVFMFMKSEAPVRFMLGGYGLHGSCDCVIVESFDCGHSDMLWIVILLDHPLLWVFVCYYYYYFNFTTDMLRLSCKMLW